MALALCGVKVSDCTKADFRIQMLREVGVQAALEGGLAGDKGFILSFLLVVA